MSELLNFFIRDYQGIKIVELTGNLSSNTVITFKSLVEQLIRKESIMINMENVGLISSAGLNALIDVSFFAKDNGRRIIFLWASDDLLEMAETTEVYNYLIFAQSLEEGQTKIRFFT